MCCSAVHLLYEQAAGALRVTNVCCLLVQTYHLVPLRHAMPCDAACTHDMAVGTRSCRRANGRRMCLQINGSLARAAIKELLQEGLITPVAEHSAQGIYTRATQAAAADAAAE